MVDLVLLLVLSLATHATASVNVFGGNEVTNEAVFQNRLWDHDSHRQLLSFCIGPKRTYYFEVRIRLEPDVNGTDVCNVADQVLLGNDLNLLLLDHGIGEAGADDDAVFLAGVCPQPTTSRRRQLVLVPRGFIWSGGGGCRFCLWDNNDNRNLQDGGNWFTNSFSPEMEFTLENAISTAIVPNHASCLGDNPVIDVELAQVSIRDLNLKCDDGRVLESLESLNLGDIALKRRNCGKCVSIDFSKDEKGHKLKKGQWIRDQWKESHGLTVTATGGYSPSFNARIFDTADAVCMALDGSLDFGSPNQNCSPQKGAGSLGFGEGKGGRPGESGENCDPVGNILVVQESNKECPDANINGGTLTFQWGEPVLLSDIGLMDVDEDNQRIKIHYADGFFETFTYAGFGDNAVQRLIASKINVVKVELSFPGTAGISEISFCPECRPLKEHDTDHHCLYTEDETLIKAKEVTYFENFENSNAYKLWENGKLAKDAFFTSMLGKYEQKSPSPYRTFYVDRKADGIIFELDFYELNSWKAGDKAAIYVDAERIEFRSPVDKGHGEGSTPIGISWERERIDQPGVSDKHHRVKIVVPRSTGFYGNGKLRLTLETDLSASATDQCAGWDNIKVTVVHSCHTLGKDEAIAQSATSSPRATPLPTPVSTDTSLRPSTGPPTRSLSPSTRQPTAYPSPAPTRQPTGSPSFPPSAHPTPAPTRQPTGSPSFPPSAHPTPAPTRQPTGSPSFRPTLHPTPAPTRQPTGSPSFRPTPHPTTEPTRQPTRSPTFPPTTHPTPFPTRYPTIHPTKYPTRFPTRHPTLN